MLFLKLKLWIALYSAWGLPEKLVIPKETILLTLKSLSDSTKIATTGGFGNVFPAICFKTEEAIFI